MKFFTSIALAVLLGVAGFSAPAKAQSGVAPQPGILPQGNWQASCRNATIVRSTLSAECQTAKALWQRSSINLSQCPSLLIGNRNGSLMCEVSGGGLNPPSYYPPGSWQTSCRNFTMHGSVLTASCSDNSGIFRTTSINVSRCTERLVANLNGILLCQP